MMQIGLYLFYTFLVAGALVCLGLFLDMVTAEYDWESYTMEDPEWEELQEADKKNSWESSTKAS